MIYSTLIKKVAKRVAVGVGTAGVALLGYTYFDNSEFASPDDAESYKKMDPVLRAQMDTMRHEWGGAIKVNSAVRTRAHNFFVGGVENSSHTAPCYCAVDVQVTSSKMRFFVVAWAIAHDINRIGIGDNFVHLDRDTSKVGYVIWTY